MGGRFLASLGLLTPNVLRATEGLKPLTSITAHMLKAYQYAAEQMPRSY
jgi:hypothetical protein